MVTVTYWEAWAVLITFGSKSKVISCGGSVSSGGGGVPAVGVGVGVLVNVGVKVGVSVAVVAGGVAAGEGTLAMGEARAGPTTLPRGARVRQRIKAVKVDFPNMSVTSSKVTQ
jgi:hypothetical protein